MSEKHRKPEALEDYQPREYEAGEDKKDQTETSHQEASQSELLEHARQEVVRQTADSEKNRILSKLDFGQEEASNEEVLRRPINSELKKLTFDKEIKHVRRQLGKVDRLGSRVIHQPIVKSISEVSAKTITRPSGLLGGGIVAFLGTTTYLYLTKHIGLKYNYSMLFFLLIAGFILGLVAEALIRLFRGRRSL